MIWSNADWNQGFNRPMSFQTVGYWVTSTQRN